MSLANASIRDRTASDTAGSRKADRLARASSPKALWQVASNCTPTCPSDRAPGHPRSSSGWAASSAALVELYDRALQWGLFAQELGLAAGVHVKVISDRLGHATTSFTQDVYMHAIPAVHAMRAGLDVYCEKPLAHSVHEVRVMRDTAKAHECVTQMGTQIHAGDNYRRAVEIVRAGQIGKVSRVHVWMNGAITPHPPARMPAVQTDCRDTACGPSAKVPGSSPNRQAP